MWIEQHWSGTGWNGAGWCGMGRSGVEGRGAARGLLSRMQGGIIAMATGCPWRAGVSRRGADIICCHICQFLWE